MPMFGGFSHEKLEKLDKLLTLTLASPKNRNPRLKLENGQPQALTHERLEILGPTRKVRDPRKILGKKLITPGILIFAFLIGNHGPNSLKLEILAKIFHYFFFIFQGLA